MSSKEDTAPPAADLPMGHTTREGVDALRKRKHSKKSIFRKNGVTSSATLSTGDVVAVPFHAYENEAFIIWATTDEEWVRSKIKGRWKPVLDHHAGHHRAQVALWVIRSEDSVVGPVLQYMLCFTVWPEDRVDQPDVCSGAESHKLFSEGAAHPYIFKVWTDSEVYATYCREVLKLDADVATEITIKPREKSLQKFRLTDSSGLLLSAIIHMPELSWCCHPDVWRAWGCCFPCACGSRGHTDQWSFAIPAPEGSAEDDNPVSSLAESTQSSALMLQVANYIFEETPQLADAVHDDNLQVLEWQFGLVGV